MLPAESNELTRNTVCLFLVTVAGPLAALLGKNRWCGWAPADREHVESTTPAWWLFQALVVRPLCSCSVEILFDNTSWVRIEIARNYLAPHRKLLFQVVQNLGVPNGSLKWSAPRALGVKCAKSFDSHSPQWWLGMQLNGRAGIWTQVCLDL